MSEQENRAIEEAAIVLDNVCYDVPGKNVLKNVSFSVHRGEIVSVMGMSGCGKTSLLRCVGALVRVSSGEIHVDGQAISRMSESELNVVREKMGMVFQYAALFDSLSVFDNVAFGLRRRKKLPEKEVRRIVKDKLALAAIPGADDLLPSELSGGMAKRVGLARALAMEPCILLYDEPTSGLDPVVSAMVDEQIVRMRDELGVTSIVVSHNLTSIFKMSDQVAMLHDGALLAFGTPDEIRTSDDPRVIQFIEGRSDGPLHIDDRV
jgi:phospholipid/cholesterol/gamma-HCH transport system ATP-binding protein